MDLEPPCNIRFCFEGEEEVGSGHLEKYVERNAHLFKSDAVMWEYGKIDRSGRPIVGLGVKGMMYMELYDQDAQPGREHLRRRPSQPGLEACAPAASDEGRGRTDPHTRLVRRSKDLDEDELKVLGREPSEAEELLSTYGVEAFAGHMSVLQAEEGADRVLRP